MKIFLALLACAAALCGTPLAAETSPAAAKDSNLASAQVRNLDDLLIDLQDSGYTIDDITRSFLGRIRVFASDPTTTREIVMSRTTGEIFSDIVRLRAPDDDLTAEPQNVTGSTSRPGNAGNNAGPSPESGARAGGGRSQGNGRSENATGRSNAGGGSGNNGGAGRANRSD